MRTKYRIIIYILFLLLPSFIAGQDDSNGYQPVKFSRIPKELIQDYAFRFGQWGQKNKLETNKAKSEFVKFAGEKARLIAVLDSAKLLMYDDSITTYLNGIKDEILQSNDAFKNHDCKIFTYRSLEPNAFSMGEGIILFNLGLLQLLETKEELAAIIAHEMSHDILDHVFLSNQRFYKELYDDRFHKTLRQVRRTAIGRQSGAQKLADEFLNQHLEFRRSEEISADSLGYILFTNVGLKGSEFIHALEKLDSLEQSRLGGDTLPIESIFHFSDYAFNPHWLNPENARSEGKVDSLLNIEEDTLKTHPDCDIRIECIRQLSDSLKIIIRDEDRGSPVPVSIVNAIAFESLGSVMLAQDYSVALFIALHMLQEFPDNVYLKTVTAHCLVELLLSIKSNDYLDYVQFQDPDFPDGYNMLLAFLHNMTSTSLKKIFDSYMAEELAGVNNSYRSFLELLGTSGEKLNYDDIYAFEQKFKDPYLSKLLKDKWLASQ